MRIKLLIERNRLFLTGSLIGCALGFIYWKLIGNHHGVFANDLNPFNNIIFCTVLGGLFLGMFQKDKWNENH